jgi:hypothetical protein
LGLQARVGAASGLGLQARVGRVLGLGFDVVGVGAGARVVCQRAFGPPNGLSAGRQRGKNHRGPAVPRSRDLDLAALRRVEAVV